MNQTEETKFREQIDQWNDADEFSRCIEAVSYTHLTDHSGRTESGTAGGTVCGQRGKSTQSLALYRRL